MSDVQVTEADREAVSALLQSLADKQKFAAVFSLVPADLYQHFAAHAARAVEAERKRCVEEIREAGRKRLEETKAEDPRATGVYFTAEELADQLQRGAG